MPLTKTPLRYPGGKSQLRPLVNNILNQCEGDLVSYVEPFCGGAGVAMELLLSRKVETIWLNDLDAGIYSFWNAVKEENARLINWIETVEVSVSEWDKQREVISARQQTGGYSFELAAAYFFMSRTNRSGVIKGGMIGGREQRGRYKIDCRFNKPNLVELIRRIGEFRESIRVSNVDGADLISSELSKHIRPEKTLVFADPPYVQKSEGLYLNTFSSSDHASLCDALCTSEFPYWLVTYDNDPLVRDLYAHIGVRELAVRYSASQRRVESELLMLSPALPVPRMPV